MRELIELEIMGEDLEKYEVYVQKNSEKYEKFINKFTKRKENLEEKLNPPPKTPKYQFFTEEITPIELKKMDKFLAHLKSYATKTKDLIKKNPENAEFYGEHYAAVINFLEKIDAKPFTDLLAEDFVLVVNHLEPYKKSFSEKCKDLLDFSLKYADVGAGIMAIVGAIAAGLIGGIAVLVMAAPITVLDGCFFFPICAAFFAYMGAIAGAIVGGAFGFLGGAVIGSYLEIPSDNPYLNNKAFKCDLLHAAYIEACKSSESANENLIESSQSLSIQQTS